MILNERKAAILKEIRKSGLPVGASYLSTRLELSQATIGRMLTEFEDNGLLEKVSNKGRLLTKQGVSFLDKYDEREGKLRSADKLIHCVEKANPLRLAEVLEVRMLLEPRAAILACENATQSDIDFLSGILLEYMYAMQHGQLGSEQDLRLHMGIARLSNNVTICRIMKLLLTSDNTYMQFSMLHHPIAIQINWHTAMVDSIKNHNPEQAANAIECHLSHLQRKLLETMKSGIV